MATIEKRGDSYLIRVNDGASKGKRRRSSKVWTPEEGMTERQIKAELQRQKILYEDQVKHNLVMDGKIKFEDYAEKWLRRREINDKLSPTTLQRYRQLMTRIDEAIGHIPLEKIRPQHLTAFYENLQEDDIREIQHYVIPNLNELLENLQMRKIDLHKKTRLAPNTIRSICNGNPCSEASLTLIAKALNMKPLAIGRPSNAKTSLSDMTILHHHRLISAILNSAVKEDHLLAVSPTSQMRPPKVEDREITFLEQDDCLLLMELLEKESIKYRTFYLLALFSGMRRSELIGLTWADVDWEHNVIYVKRSTVIIDKSELVTKNPKTSKSRRAIYLDPPVMEMLKEYQAWQDSEKEIWADQWIDSDRLFTKRNGSIMSPDTASQWFRKFLKRQENLPSATLHSLRHSNATIRIASGVDIATVSASLGHSKVTTTVNIYTHALQAAEAAAAATLGKALSKENMTKLNAKQPPKKIRRIE